MQLNHKQNQQLVKKRKRQLQKETDRAAKRQALSSKDPTNTCAEADSASDGSPDEKLQGTRTSTKKAKTADQNPEELFDGLFD